jgi:hypothetical protein
MQGELEVLGRSIPLITIKPIPGVQVPRAGKKSGKLPGN